MDALINFRQRLERALRQSDEQRLQHDVHMRQRMEEIARRSDQFNKAAAVLLATVIRPRMELLAGKFEGAKILDTPGGGGHRSICTFERNTRFPASTSLEFAVVPNDRIDEVVVTYHLEILPVFIEFKGHDQLALPLGGIDETDAGQWVEDRIADFVDAYLRLETAKAYQDENMETDPVCGMPVNRNWAAATAEYGGKRYYFCIDDCRRRFDEEPSRWVQETRRSKEA